MQEIGFCFGPDYANSNRPQKGKSLLEFPEDYTVLDIETTGFDSHFDEIIEVAAIRYKNGIEFSYFQSLIKPEKPISDFIKELTGITNASLENAPSLETVLPKFRDFLGSDILIGHNVNFDINFIYDFSQLLNLAPLCNDFVDTLRLSRRLFPDMRGQKLSTLCERCSLPTNVAHRAFADCEMVQGCFAFLQKYVHDNNIDLHIPSYSALSKSLSPNTQNFNFDSPVYGKMFVFTGKLDGLTRREAMQCVLDCGGQCNDRVTADTNFLVLGNTEYCSTLNGKETEKQQKAQKLQLQGYDIITISESVFYEMIQNSVVRKIGQPDTDTENEQIALQGFEPPYEEERLAYHEIFPMLSAAATKIGGIPEEINIKHGIAYSSIKYKSSVAFRLKLRGRSRYIEVPIESKSTIARIAPETRQSKRTDGYWRVQLAESTPLTCAYILGKVLQDAINRLPKEWDCCSRYMECSDAKRCVHPDPALALACGYRKILTSGKIYYGKNRNID